MAHITTQSRKRDLLSALALGGLKFRKCHGARSAGTVKYAHGRATGDGCGIVEGSTCADASRSIEARPSGGHVPGVRFEQERSGEQTFH